MSPRYFETSEKSFISIYSCRDCPAHKEEKGGVFCSRMSREVPGGKVPSWCPLGEVEDMISSKPKLEG